MQIREIQEENSGMKCVKNQIVSQKPKADLKI